jgi:hypothetical protein
MDCTPSTWSGIQNRVMLLRVRGATHQIGRHTFTVMEMSQQTHEHGFVCTKHYAQLADTALPPWSPVRNYADTASWVRSAVSDLQTELHCCEVLCAAVQTALHASEAVSASGRCNFTTAKCGSACRRLIFISVKLCLRVAMRLRVGEVAIARPLTQLRGRGAGFHFSYCTSRYWSAVGWHFTIVKCCKCGFTAMKLGWHVFPGVHFTVVRATQCHCHLVASLFGSPNPYVSRCVISLWQSIVISIKYTYGGCISIAFDLRKTQEWHKSTSYV